MLLRKRTRNSAASASAPASAAQAAQGPHARVQSPDIATSSAHTVPSVEIVSTKCPVCSNDTFGVLNHLPSCVGLLAAMALETKDPPKELIRYEEYMSRIPDEERGVVQGSVQEAFARGPSGARGLCKPHWKEKHNCVQCAQEGQLVSGLCTAHLKPKSACKQCAHEGKLVSGLCTAHKKQKHSCVDCKVTDAYNRAEELIRSVRTKMAPACDDAVLQIQNLLETNLPGFLEPETGTVHCHGGYPIRIALSSNEKDRQFTAPPCSCPGGITVKQMCMGNETLNDRSEVFRIKRNTCPCTQYCPSFAPDLKKINGDNVEIMLVLALNTHFQQGDNQFMELLAKCQFKCPVWKAFMLRCSFVHHCCHEATEAKAKEHSGPLKLGATLFSQQRTATQANVDILLPSIPALLSPIHRPTLKALMNGTATASALLKFLGSCL